MKRLFLLLPFFALIAAGCRAQLPSTVWTVNVAATAPANCTATHPCTLAISSAQVAGSSCPALGGYVQVCTIASNGTSCTDSTVKSGQNYCYIAQTIQDGGTSLPSPVSAPVAVPQVPTAPGAPAPSLQATSQIAYLLLPEAKEIAACNLVPEEMKRSGL